MFFPRMVSDSKRRVSMAALYLSMCSRLKAIDGCRDDISVYHLKTSSRNHGVVSASGSSLLCFIQYRMAAGASLKH